MDIKYKNILLYIIIVISSADCWMMLVRDKKSFFIFIIIGALIGIILCQIYSKSQKYVSKIITMLSSIAGLFFCYKLSILFYRTWITNSKVEMIAGWLSLNTVIFLKIFSYVMGLIALPSVIFALSKFVQWLVYCWHLIDKRKVWEDVRIFFSIKSILSILANVVGAAILGTILIIGAYALPIAPIEEHVNSSAIIFENEGTNPALFSWCTSRIDTWTDAIMLLEAADDTVDSIENKAMIARHKRVSGYNPSESLVAHYINGMEFSGTVTYARYWHGYQVILRPLLEIMNYQSIRKLNAIIQLSLVVFVSCLIAWRKIKGFLIPYLLSYLMLMPVALTKSLQFSNCWYVLTFAMIAILLTKNKEKSNSIYFIFLNIGIATSFFDYLTYPIATFGAPILLFIFMYSEYTVEWKLGSLSKTLFCWGVGYAGMWSLKWIIATLITGNNVILEALNQVSVRASNSSMDGDIHYSRIQCIASNMVAFIKTPFTLLVVVFVILMIIRIWRKNHLTLHKVCNQLIPYIIVALMPLFWYAFATNHATIHSWFTNKACVVSVLAIVCGIVELDKLNKKKEEMVNGK